MPQFIKKKKTILCLIIRYSVFTKNIYFSNIIWVGIFVGVFVRMSVFFFILKTSYQEVITYISILRYDDDNDEYVCVCILIFNLFHFLRKLISKCILSMIQENYIHATKKKRTNNQQRSKGVFFNRITIHTN